MPVNEYFESIKHNKAKLRQFFADMPKGADLHHHLTGAAYAETLFAIAYNAQLYVNPDTGRLSDGAPDPKKYHDADKYIQLTAKTFEADEYGCKKYDFHSTRMSLIDKWSVRNYHPYKYPLGADEYFFSLFGNFIAAAGNKYLPEIVHQLKVRAKEENLQYIESIGISPTVPNSVFLSEKDRKGYADDFEKWSRDIVTYEDNIRNSVKKIIGEYDRLYEDTNSELYQTVQKYVADNVAILKTPSQIESFITSKFDTTIVSDDDVLIKLQGYASRDKDPLIVLCQLYIVLKAMTTEEGAKNIVGCNLVAAENSENSMQYYMVHMLMLSELGKDFENKYGKGPNIALHAGELTMGLVPPEHLTYHVFYAVMVGGARRIGHGVDIVFEHDSASFLNLMKENDIAIEINLTSNEFILGVKGDSHPFNLYKESGVPIVISTDDPGILRTSITEEFSRAAYRYNLTYDEVKMIARNSIKYSFLNDDDKKTISDAFESKLKDFEDSFNDD